MRTLVRIGLLLPMLFNASSAISHHSIGGEFRDEQVTVEGVVTQFELINPHAYIVIEVGDGADLADTRIMDTDFHRIDIGSTPRRKTTR